MARIHKNCDQVESLRNYLEGVAKKLADELWGPKGPEWGTSLTQLEKVALEARSILSQKLLEIGLDRQATTLSAEPPQEVQQCPDCQRPFGDLEQPKPREVDTRAGGVHWQEPQAYCTRCRRAFFPSE